MAQFLYRFLPGDRPELAVGPEAWTEADLEVAQRHAAHLEASAASGIVLVAGRSQDWSGPALVILEADDEAAARAFMEADPFVSEGLFRGALHPFRIAFGPLAGPSPGDL
jgi:uncharacterized protein YciI